MAVSVSGIFAIAREYHRLAHPRVRGLQQKPASAPCPSIARSPLPQARARPARPRLVRHAHRGGRRHEARSTPAVLTDASAPPLPSSSCAASSSWRDRAIPSLLSTARRPRRAPVLFSAASDALAGVPSAAGSSPGSTCSGVTVAAGSTDSSPSSDICPAPSPRFTIIALGTSA